MSIGKYVFTNEIRQKILNEYILIGKKTHKQFPPKDGDVRVKTYIFDSREDIHIYRDNRTKKKWWYVKIYTGRRPGKGHYWNKSLKTTDKAKAIVMAENIYVNKEYLK